MWPRCSGGRSKDSAGLVNKGPPAAALPSLSLPAPVSSATLYFDYNATTPLDPGVRAVLLRALEEPWGNPSSVHRLGRAARACLDDARDQVAALFRCRPSEIVFTAGGTEANNLAVLGAARARRDRGRHLLCSPTEHPAVLHAHESLARHEGFTLTLLPVDDAGRVSPEAVAALLRPDTVLVSVMAANNETGLLQPVAEIGGVCRARGILFHTDAVQAFGKLPFKDIDQFQADLVTLCAHKIHGPKGVGLLYVRSPLLLSPVLVGGAQEGERRAGTENLPLILGMVDAILRFVSDPVFPAAMLAPWTASLAAVLGGLEGVHLHSRGSSCLSNTLAFSVEDTDSIALLAALDLAGICASSGSACASGSVEPSHVLRAMGVPEALAGALVRFSLGRETRPEEVTQVLDLLPPLLTQVRHR